MRRLIIIAGIFVLLIVVAIFMMMQETKQSTSQTQITTNQPVPTNGQGAALANPASVNCQKVGGTLTIQTNGSGGQYGLCNFADNMSCEEWALFRGECPVGGVKTTGYDNIQQMYCAWIGGQTLAVPNAQCKMPGGKTCPVDALYNGTCPKYPND